MSLLTLEDVCVSYENNSQLTISNINLCVNDSEILCIVGESGSGKTTLLNSILNLLPNQAKMTGKIVFQNMDLCQIPLKVLEKKRGKDITVVFQDTGRFMNPIQKIGKQFSNYLKQKGYRDDYRILAKELFEKVGLLDVDRILNSYPFELSGGMRQRVGIAFAISLQPKLLLADEPTSALDVTVQKQVADIFVMMKQRYQTAIIIVTHNMGLAKYISDKICVMKDGEIVEFGETSQVINFPKSAYTKLLIDAIVDLEDEQL